MNMKKMYLLLMVAAMMLVPSFHGFAQLRNDGGLTYEKGQIYQANGQEITDEQALALFGSELYNATYVGAKKQSSIGRKLIVPGAIVAGAGAVTSIVGGVVLGIGTSEGSDAVSGTGAAVFSLGMLAFVAGDAMLSAGIPLRVIGNRRLEWLTNDYNSRSQSAQRTPTVTFGAQKHGMGIALNF